MKKYDVITIGSGLVDAFLHCGFKEVNGKITLPAGTKISVNRIEFSTGGGGTNTATAFSTLGLKTGFIGKVGAGNNANIIMRELKKNKVDFLGISDSKMHTGYSIVLLSDKNNRTILTYKGASNRLKPKEIPFKKINAKWIHFTSMGDGSFESQKKIIDYAVKKSIKYSFNPSSYQTKKGAKHLSKFLKNAEVISLNKEEAKMLVPKGDVCEGLKKLGPKIVLVTNGPKPGEVYDGEFKYAFYPTNIKKLGGSTGAGDVFASTFIVGLIKLKDVEKAIKLAMANSESMIKQRGAKTGILNWNNALKASKSGRYKVVKSLK